MIWFRNVLCTQSSVAKNETSTRWIWIYKKNKTAYKVLSQLFACWLSFSLHKMMTYVGYFISHNEMNRNCTKVNVHHPVDYQTHKRSHFILWDYCKQIFFFEQRGQWKLFSLNKPICMNHLKVLLCTEMAEATSYSHTNKTQRLFLKLPPLCVCCPSYHQGLQAFHIQLVDWGKTQAAPAANNVKLVSKRHTTEVVLWCQKKSCLRHKQLTLTSLSSSVDPNCSSHRGSTHPKTHKHSPCNPNTAKRLEVNHCDRQIKQGAWVKM